MIHKKRVVFLPNISLKKLGAWYHLERNAKSKIRLQCAILRKEGKTLEEISDATKKPKSTIGDILMRFDKKGIVAKDAIKQNGQPKKLSDLQCKKIKKMFRVIYSLLQIRNLLKRLMFSLQKQRPEPIRANKEIQREFKKEFGEELENLIQMDMRSSFWMKAHSNLSHTS